MVPMILLVTRRLEPMTPRSCDSRRHTAGEASPRTGSARRACDEAQPERSIPRLCCRRRRSLPSSRRRPPPLVTAAPRRAVGAGLHSSSPSKRPPLQTQRFSMRRLRGRRNRHDCVRLRSLQASRGWRSRRRKIGCARSSPRLVRYCSPSGSSATRSSLDGSERRQTATLSFCGTSPGARPGRVFLAARARNRAVHGPLKLAIVAASKKASKRMATDKAGIHRSAMRPRVDRWRQRTRSLRHLMNRHSPGIYCNNSAYFTSSYDSMSDACAGSCS